MPTSHDARRSHRSANDRLRLGYTCEACGVEKRVGDQSFRTCPLCVKQPHLTPAHFCSESCFASEWEDHLLWHEREEASLRDFRASIRAHDPRCIADLPAAPAGPAPTAAATVGAPRAPPPIKLPAYLAVAAGDDALHLDGDHQQHLEHLSAIVYSHEDAELRSAAKEELVHELVQDVVVGTASLGTASAMIQPERYQTATSPGAAAAPTMPLAAAPVASPAASPAVSPAAAAPSPPLEPPPQVEQPAAAATPHTPTPTRSSAPASAAAAWAVAPAVPFDSLNDFWTHGASALLSPTRSAAPCLSRCSSAPATQASRSQDLTTFPYQHLPPTMPLPPKPSQPTAQPTHASTPTPVTTPATHGAAARPSPTSRPPAASPLSPASRRTSLRSLAPSKPAVPVARPASAGSRPGPHSGPPTRSPARPYSPATWRSSPHLLSAPKPGAPREAKGPSAAKSAAASPAKSAPGTPSGTATPLAKLRADGTGKSAGSDATSRAAQALRAFIASRDERVAQSRGRLGGSSPSVLGSRGGTAGGAEGPPSTLPIRATPRSPPSPSAPRALSIDVVDDDTSLPFTSQHVVGTLPTNSAPLTAAQPAGQPADGEDGTSETWTRPSEATLTRRPTYTAREMALSVQAGAAEAAARAARAAALAKELRPATLMPSRYRLPPSLFRPSLPMPALPPGWAAMDTIHHHLEAHHSIDDEQTDASVLLEHHDLAALQEARRMLAEVTSEAGLRLSHRHEAGEFEGGPAHEHA